MSLDGPLGELHRYIPVLFASDLQMSTKEELMALLNEPKEHGRCRIMWIDEKMGSDCFGALKRQGAKEILTSNRGTTSV